jgi:hypothetical protein
MGVFRSMTISALSHVMMPSGRTAIVQLHMIGCNNTRNFAVLTGLYHIINGGLSVALNDVITVEEVKGLCVVVDVVMTVRLMEVGEVNVPVVGVGDSKGHVGGKRECVVWAQDTEVERPDSQTDQPGFSQG